MRPGWILAGLAGCMLLVVVFTWQSREAGLNALQQQLQEVLPPAIMKAAVNRVDHNDMTRFLATRIDQDLAQIRPGTAIGQIQHCHASVLSLQGQAFSTPVPGDEILQIDWQLNNGARESLQLNVACHMDWPRLLASQFALALAGLLLIGVLPVPLTERRRYWMKRFIAAGEEPARARKLSRNADACSDMQREILSLLLEQPGVQVEEAIQWAERPEAAHLQPRQLSWFALALKHCQGDTHQALTVAGSEPTLRFMPEKTAVCCHGVTVSLPSTPFFYYYWYATLRVEAGEDGWFSNPAANRPDKQAAGGLVALMERHGGHARAIKELREKGLRAKILDQNRSKLKDELEAVLGETLAADFLFEQQRDSRTARYLYRLQLPPDAIMLPATSTSHPATSMGHPLK